METVGFFPGSFDPPTYGHVDIMRRAVQFLDRLVVGVGPHHSKTPLLPATERVSLLRHLAQALEAETAVKIEVQSFSSLTVEAAQRCGARFLIRGLRAGTDVGDELGLAVVNEKLAPDIFTIFLSAPAGVAHISSSLVKQVAALGGSIREFVPERVAQMMVGATSAPQTNAPADT